MNRLLFLLFIFIFLLFTCMSCPTEESDNCHKYVKIKNESDKNLYISWGWAWHNLNYSNGDLKESINMVKKERIEAGSEDVSAISVKDDCLEAPAQGIYVYIFDADEFDSHDWDYISENNMYLEYHLLTYEKLSENNWTIIYSDKIK